MIKDFNNRVEVQRETIKIINSSKLFESAIYGLSDKAIKRWIIENQLDENAIIINLVKTISKKLFFLANKSQEQITTSYKILSTEIIDLQAQLTKTLSLIEHSED